MISIQITNLLVRFRHDFILIYLFWFSFNKMVKTLTAPFLELLKTWKDQSQSIKVPMAAINRIFRIVYGDLFDEGALRKAIDEIASNADQEEYTIAIEAAIEARAKAHAPWQAAVRRGVKLEQHAPLITRR